MVELFNSACISGNLKAVKYLKSQFVEFTNWEPLTYGLEVACQHGHLNIVEYLMPKDANSIWLSKFLDISCKYDQLDVVKFIVENTDKYDLKKIFDSAYLESCSIDKLDILKYLIMKSKEYDFDFGWGIYDKGFAYSCQKAEDVMNYFIYDLKFQYDYSVGNLIEKHTDKKKEQIFEHIKKRNLFFSLGDKLKNKEIIKIKENKI